MIEKQDKLAALLAEGGERVTEPSVPRSERPAATLALQRFQATQDDAQRALRTWLLAAPTSGYTITGDDRALCERMGIPLGAKQVELRLSTRPMRDLDGAADWEYRAQSVARRRRAATPSRTRRCGRSRSPSWISAGCAGRRP